MRKLASVRKISEIKSIPNADAIEVAIIDGWECVVRKSEGYKVGDLIVYFEPDSVLPEKPEFEFLRDKKFRVRVMKLRGQVSSGLVCSISILPNKKWKEGDDVTDIIGVTKYDPELIEENKLVKDNGSKKKYKNPIIKWLMRFKWFRNIVNGKPIDTSFPYWVKKTDEERLQNMVNMFNRERDEGTVFTGTEKVDGQSATYTLRRIKRNKFDFVVCSRNLRLKEDNSNYWKIARKHNLKEVLKDLIGDKEFVTIQGEIYGQKIQGNKYKLDDIDFRVFNLIYPDRNVPTDEFTEILKRYRIKSVPIVVQNYKLPETIHDVVEFSKGKSVLYNRNREGIVFRNYEKNISFKVINPDFLLEEK